MSVISEKVRKALYAKLNVAAVVGSGKATAVYESVAPESATLPYVLINRIGPGPVTYVVFGTTQILENDLWQIKVLADENSSTTKEPQELCEDILALCESTHGTTLTLTGNTVDSMKRVSDIPPYQELQNDRFIYHRGYNLQIQVS